MNLVQRVQDILLRPQPTWPVIEQEPATPASLYQGYLVFLAAIPAIAGFIGLSVVGIGALGVNYRVPVVWGLVNMVVGFVLTLVMVFVMALVVDALAPTFQGQKNRLNALKLMVYGSTAGLVGGIFNLIPSQAILGLLAAIYTIYLIYTGLPVLMKCPPDKAVGYTAVVIVCGIVAGIVLGVVSSLFTAPRMGAFGGASSGGDRVTLSTPGGDVTIDTSKLDAMAKRMEEAGKKMEAAQASGDTAAAGKAAQDILGAMAGTTGTPVAPEELRALLPDGLAGMKRTAIEAQGNQAMGIAGSSAKATYADGDKRVLLSITDIGGMGGLAALAGWASSTLDRETEEGIERVYKQGERTVREKSRKDGSHAEYTVILPNGVIVEADGRRVAPADLKSAVEGLDLARLQSMKRPAKS